MTDFPRSPRLIKGALVLFDIPSHKPQAILFQYNPDSLTRTLKGQTSGGEGDAAELFRLKGPPVETISLDIELDATDQLEHPDQEQNKNATTMGIYPQLAALEMILYPRSSIVISNSALAASGALECVPPEAPLAVFIWGSKRVLPVQLTDFRITEEAHDTNLNPTRAKVSLGLRVMSYADLKLSHPASTLFMAHQVIKETMAAVGSINDLTAAGNPKIF
jgi:hypothetical protein